MYTSYFHHRGVHLKTNIVSIALRTPHWFKGRKYRWLAPPPWLLRAWHRKEIGEMEYESSYRAEVLQFLNARDVYDWLGRDAVLLCYELPGYFCHRQIVAKWLEESLGIEVPELPDE